MHDWTKSDRKKDRAISNHDMEMINHTCTFRCLQSMKLLIGRYKDVCINIINLNLQKIGAIFVQHSKSLASESATSELTWHGKDYNKHSLYFIKICLFKLPLLSLLLEFHTIQRKNALYDEWRTMFFCYKTQFSFSALLDD